MSSPLPVVVPVRSPADVLDGVVFRPDLRMLPVVPMAKPAAVVLGVVGVQIHTPAAVAALADVGVVMLQSIDIVAATVVVVIVFEALVDVSMLVDCRGVVASVSVPVEDRLPVSCASAGVWR